MRLSQGDLRHETRYDDDPVERARSFARAGAKLLHVVDLDGAFGSGENEAALRAICSAVDIPVQTGGGIRHRSDVLRKFELGASFAILGTVIAEHPEIARAIAGEFGQRIVAGIDARGERLAVRGWAHESSLSRDDAVRAAASWGVGRIIFTEIARDGVGSGYDIDALAHVASLSDVAVTASGGAKTIDDLRTLFERTPPNVDQAICGRALYEGTIDLAEALEALHAFRR